MCAGGWLRGVVRPAGDGRNLCTMPGVECGEEGRPPACQERRGLGRPGPLRAAAALLSKPAGCGLPVHL